VLRSMATGLSNAEIGAEPFLAGPGKAAWVNAASAPNGSMAGERPAPGPVKGTVVAAPSRRG
jgi:hypothetical protein